MAAFPKGKYMDLTDSATQAINYLRAVGLGSFDEVIAAAEQEKARRVSRIASHVIVGGLGDIGDTVLGLAWQAAARLCRQSTHSGTFQVMAAWSHMESISWNRRAAALLMWTAFCEGQIRANFQCNCRPNMSWP